MSKISVNGIVDKILKYTEMYHADNLVGIEDYGYRDIGAYKNLLATVIERSYDMSLADKLIIDKSIKQEGNVIKIANSTIAGLIVYLIFIAKSDRFFRYHRLCKSNKEYSLKDHEKIFLIGSLKKLLDTLTLRIFVIQMPKITLIYCLKLLCL